MKNSIIQYFSGSISELKKVTWPTKQQSFRLTGVVLGFGLVVALIIGIVDFALNQGLINLLNIAS